MVEVSLTVGKVDASLAILTTSDHYVIEFPTVLLPEKVEAGSVVKISVEQDLDQEKQRKQEFEAVQDQILEKYGTDPPTAPVLHLSNATQTSCVVHWDPLHLGSSQLKSLVLYKQKNRHQVLKSLPKDGSAAENSLKISGLSVDFEYEFQLLLNTTSGKYWSNVLKVHTHKMTDLSGITVCVGKNTDLGNHVTRDQIKQSLANIGAKPLQEHVTIETTHFITLNQSDENNDEELIKAKDNNIPIVRPEWVRACELEKRIVGVRDFYLDSNPANFSNYTFSDVTEGSLDKPLPEQPAEGTTGVNEKPSQEQPTQEEPQQVESPESEAVLAPQAEPDVVPVPEVEPEAAPKAVSEAEVEALPESKPQSEVVPDEGTAVVEEHLQEDSLQDTPVDVVEPVTDDADKVLAEQEPEEIAEISLDEPVAVEQMANSDLSQDVITEAQQVEVTEEPLTDSPSQPDLDKNVADLQGEPTDLPTEETSPETVELSTEKEDGQSDETKQPSTSSKKKNKKKKKGKK